MDLSIRWAGADVYPQYGQVVSEIVAGEVVRRSGSVRGAAVLRDSWDQTGRPAGSFGWSKVVRDSVIAVQRYVPPVIFSNFPGIRIDFVGR